MKAPRHFPCVIAGSTSRPTRQAPSTATIARAACVLGTSTRVPATGPWPMSAAPQWSRSPSAFAARGVDRHPSLHRLRRAEVEPRRGRRLAAAAPASGRPSAGDGAVPAGPAGIGLVPPHRFPGEQLRAKKPHEPPRLLRVQQFPGRKRRNRHLFLRSVAVSCASRNTPTAAATRPRPRARWAPPRAPAPPWASCAACAPALEGR